jgi:hypothetical protein
MNNLPVRQAVVFLSAFMMLALPEQAPAQQNSPYAMRAPLDIIPAPMRQAVGQLDAVEDKGAGKLAPRVAARQMKRAVRAVAALPGSQTQIVQVGQLGALEDAPVGLEPGYGPALWQGARLAFVTDLMARLPRHYALPALRELERGLHRSATAAPNGSTQGVSWTAARLNRFLAIGDTQSVLDLTALTGVDARDAHASRAKVLALLGQGNVRAACAQSTPSRGMQGRKDTRAFFLQLLIFCHLSRSDFAPAALAVELNEKTLADDPVFRELAFLLAAQAPILVKSQKQLQAEMAEDQTPENTENVQISEPETDTSDAASQATKIEPIILPAELTALQISLLRLAAQPLPIDDDIVPAYLLGLVASDYVQSGLVQARAAVQGLAYGGMAAASMTQLSQLGDFSAYLPTALPALPMDTPAPVWIGVSLQQIERSAPEDRPRLMAYYLRQAAKKGVWQDMVLALSLHLQEMATPRMIRPGDTASLLPALVMIGAHRTAGQLYGVHGASLTRVSQRLFALSQPEFPLPKAPPLTPEPDLAETKNSGDFEVVLGAFEAQDSQTAEPPLTVNWLDLQAETQQAAPVVQRYLALEITVLRGLGFEAPESVMSGLQAAQISPISPMARRWLQLAEDKWVGDLVLAVTADMAERRVETWDKQEIYALLKALRVAGLTPQAVRLGQELLAREFANLGRRHADVLSVMAPDMPPADGLQFRLPRDLVSEDWLRGDWLETMPSLDTSPTLLSDPPLSDPLAYEEGGTTARELE